MLVGSGPAGPATTPYALYLFTDGKLYFDIGDNASHVQEVVSGVITTNVWHMASAWYDSSKVYIAIDNGASNSAAATFGSYSGTNFFSLCGRTNYFFTGMVDEAGLWSRVLTTGERTYLYNAGLGTHFPWAHP